MTYSASNTIAGQNLPGWVDIGVGPSSADVQPIASKLVCANAYGAGAIYWLPLRIPIEHNVYARLQAYYPTLSNVGITLTVVGGQMNPGSFPVSANIASIGDGPYTCGTTIVPGASGAEGSWTQITASTIENYDGFLVSRLFNIDQTMTGNLYNTLDIGIGGAGAEVSIGENVTTQFIQNTNEQVTSISYPTFIGAPKGSRISVRCSGSTTADTGGNVVVYGFRFL
jgi:hypothetical protein